MEYRQGVMIPVIEHEIPIWTKLPMAAIIITTIMSTIAKVAFTVFVFENRCISTDYIYARLKLELCV